MLVPLVVLALAATAVVVGLLLGRLELGGPLGVRARPEEPALTALTITEVRDHDPQGDGIEHPERVGAAADGNPATTWETEGYNSAALGGIKDGVGIVLDFGASHEVREVVVTTTLPGWRFELMTSDDGVTFSAPLAAEDGSTSFRAGGRTEVRLEPARARYLLVWIVELAPEGDRYRADVAEVEVRGRP